MNWIVIGLLWFQATAQISGTVRDQSGAVLPGVEVTATQTETGIARSTVTNETGLYVLSNLPLGPYKLEAALANSRDAPSNSRDAPRILKYKNSGCVPGI